MNNSVAVDKGSHNAALRILSKQLVGQPKCGFCNAPWQERPGTEEKVLEPRVFRKMQTLKVGRK